MKKKIIGLLLTLVISAFLLCPSITLATTVTFEDVTNTTPTPFSSGGFDFAGGSTTYVWNGPGYNADNGTLNLISGFDDSFTITKSGGGTFDLNQLDAGLSWYTGLTSFDITIGSETITLDQTFQTFTFTTLTNLSSITIAMAPSDGYFSMDNIVFDSGSPVPEPATMLLFGLGLLGLAGVNRKKK